MHRRSGLLAIAFIVAWGYCAAAQPNPSHGHSKDHAGKSAVQKQSARALKPAEGASIQILVPAKGQAIKGDKVDIHFKLTRGKQGHHAHAYVDGELMGMFESETGALNGIKPGKHVLELRVVAKDHKTELDASDKVEFSVR